MARRSFLGFSVRTLYPFFAGALLGACSGKLEPGASATDGAPNEDAGLQTDGGAPAVVDHRAHGASCAPTPTGPEPTIFDAGLPEGTRFDCQTNEDCTAHAGGRCIFTFMREANVQSDDLGTRCHYDECAVDSDCPASSVCECGGGGAAPNSCSPVGDCRVDADCASGVCSPSVDGCATPNGYFCRTPADECSTDADCRDKGGLSAKCIVDPSSQTWVCQEVGCASAG